MNYRTTRTGSYRIGMRRGWSDWQKDLPDAVSPLATDRESASGGERAARPVVAFEEPAAKP